VVEVGPMQGVGRGAICRC